MRKIDPGELLLSSGLDLGRPFTAAMADDAGVDRRYLSALVADGSLIRPILGVLCNARIEMTLAQRVECLRLVVPDDAVITDRTAGWLHGAPMILAPGDHLAVPRVSVFQSPGHRLRNQLAASGERSFLAHDVMEIDGLVVTTPLRTTCDLGRLLRRDAAWAALDSMLRLGVDHEALLQEVERFRGYRGVRQLRTFAPLSDPGAESFGESVLRLRWYDAGLTARPETQVEVRRGGRVARLDIANRERRYAAEYDGAEFHGPAEEAHDRARRAWIAEEGWVVDVFRASNVFGRAQDVHATLVRGLRRASLTCAGVSGRRP